MATRSVACKRPVRRDDVRLACRGIRERALARIRAPMANSPAQNGEGECGRGCGGSYAKIGISRGRGAGRPPGKGAAGPGGGRPPDPHHRLRRGRPHLVRRPSRASPGGGGGDRRSSPPCRPLVVGSRSCHRDGDARHPAGAKAPGAAGRRADLGRNQTAARHPRRWSDRPRRFAGACATARCC